MANIRHIFGNVNADGTIESGENFDVIKVNTGVYVITFRPVFQSMPTVVTLQNYQNWNDFNYNGGSSRDNSVLIAVDQGQCKILTGDGQGNHTDRNFGFIAIGEAE